MFSHVQPFFRPALTLAFSFSLLLAGCGSASDAKKEKKEPVSLQKVEPVAAHGIAEQNNDVKIDKLEKQIADLQREVAAARPKIAKIDVMEQKFKDLSLGLDRIDATYNMKSVAHAPVAAPTPVAHPEPLPIPAQAPEKPVVTAPVAPPPKPIEKPLPKPEPVKTEPKADGKVVKDLRIGEKKDFSRLVLDLGQPVKVSYDIDNDEKILVVDVPGYKWEAAKTKSFPNSLLIASYQVTEDADGAHLVIQLKQAAKIANYSNIDPTGGKMARAVLDVAAQ